MQTVSACMIVRNEEVMLPACLESIAAFVDEIIVVDTGSEDTTHDIAKDHGARQFEFPWNGDFSAARNYSIKQATGDWVFIIDADERLLDGKKLVEAAGGEFEGHPFDAVYMNVESVHLENDKFTGFHPSLRMWKRDLGLCYEGVIHNRIKLDRNVKRYRSDLVIRHLGYDINAPKFEERKKQRQEMIAHEIKKRPDDARLLVDYAQSIRVKDDRLDPETAEEVFRSCMKAARITAPEFQPGYDTHVEALSIGGWAAYTRQDYPKAIWCGLESVKFKENFLDPMLLLTRAYAAGGNWKECYKWACRYLETRRAYNPLDETQLIQVVYLNYTGEAWYWAGFASERLNLTDQGINCYMSALRHDDGHAGAFDRMERLFTANVLSRGEWEKIQKYKPKTEEKGPEYYDEIFAEPYDTKRYKPVYDQIVNWVGESEDSVLEIGCGTGDLGERLEKGLGLVYNGIDFSSEAVLKAQERGIEAELGNLYDPNWYNDDYDTIVATEVLEHVNDFEVMRNIPAGKRVIASVPNFWDPAHLRVYSSEVVIRERFTGILDIKQVKEFTMSENGQKILLFDAIRV